MSAEERTVVRNLLVQGYEVVLGLEIHAQLATRSKIFSGAATAYGSEPNTQACLVDLGYPGVLPVLNAEAVRMAIRFGLAIGATVAPRSVFARKNYFYPDLPKGYQISQYELPVVSKGTITIRLDSSDGKGSEKVIGVTRAHLEEDAGKSLHEGFAGQSGIDLNRAGTPLLEIVSEPDMRSAAEAVAYMKRIHQLVVWLGICDGNMQEGSLRCDANVSIRKPGAKLGTRCEIKNLNSFRFIEKAIAFEVARQIEIVEGGGTIKQETRLYDSARDETRSLRAKEEANDYRYFPDPDLLPLEISADDMARERAALPELPDAMAARFESAYGLPRYDAEVLTASRALAAYYEEVVKAVGGEPKTCANWVMGDLSAVLNARGVGIEQSPIAVGALAGLVKRIVDGTISGRTAKEVFEAMVAGEGDADAIIERKGLKQVSDSGALERAIDEVLAKNPSQVAAFKGGKEALFGFFVGQVMKATGGKANPGVVNELLKKKLAG
jgi:aspartyl-tRNA(Asn)/glutamyl-tRNA(Gln) amidotransferase subunit B